MTIEALTEAAKQSGLKIGWTNKGYFKLLAAKIPDDDTVELCVSTAAQHHVVVTNRKVYILDGSKMLGADSATIGRDKITGVTTSGKLLKDVEIATAGRPYVLKKVAIPDAMKIEDLLA